MKYEKFSSPLFFILLAFVFISCQEQSGNQPVSADNDNRKSGSKPGIQNITKGKGSLSFKMDGQLYNTDPQSTKCWSTSNVPLAMLMAKGEDLSISWQMGYSAATNTYKLDGDNAGTVNFTIGKKTYWTRSGTGDNYLNIKITGTKDKYSVILLSGTFEGVLEDKDGNKVQITEGNFVTEDI